MENAFFKHFLEGTKIAPADMIEEPDLKLSCEQRRIMLPEEAQREMGISSIRHKKLNLHGRLESLKRISPDIVLHSPEALSQLKPILDWLTEGRLYNEATWTHVMFAASRTINSAHRWARPESHDTVEAILKEFRSKQFFQEVFPSAQQAIDTASTPTRFVFEKKDGDIISCSSGETGSTESPYGVFNMSVAEGGPWKHSTFAPTFVFGKNNRALQDYLHTVTSNPEAMAMLQQVGWKCDVPLHLWRPTADDIVSGQLIGAKLSDAKQAVQQGHSLIAEKYNLPHGYSSADKLYPNLATLQFLLDGEPVNYSGQGHPYIPAVAHPDINPLRWCHSELGVVPTKNALHVLFFEK